MELHYADRGDGIALPVHWGVVVLGLCIAVTSSWPAAAAQHRALSTEASCRAAAQAFYDWYVPIVKDAGRRRRGETADVTALRRRPHLFDPALARLLRADAAARMRSRDEIVGLDGDPFLLAQDFATAYRVGDVKVMEDRCRATVATADPAIAPYHIIASLRRTTAGWIFVDVFDSDGKGLVELLQTLARERRAKR